MKIVITSGLTVGRPCGSIMSIEDVLFLEIPAHVGDHVLRIGTRQLHKLCCCGKGY